MQTANAMNRTVSLFSTKGKRTQDFDALFLSTLSDKKQNNFDGINDPNNLPIEQEPDRVLFDLDAVRQ
ncbi:hypothetical protein RHO15_07020 [Utexia brackfieldae]|uniref:hypothetical protein n=1 Tax=Utexia brackfieldae TaxID=3074108 RepID=UPI00370DD4AD